MRHRSKIKSMRIVLRFIMALTLSLFVLGLSNSQKAEGFHSHKGWFWKPEPVSCGDEITTYTILTSNLDCSEHDGTALTLYEGAKLNLNRKKVIGNFDINCIEIRGDGARVWNGTVTQCDNGIRVRSNRNKIKYVEVSESASRGIRIDGDENLVINCYVAHNGRQGIKINGGNRNSIFYSKVYDNCRDGIEIDEGNYNWVYYNHVEDNGNEDTCNAFEEDYKPRFYAGIDILSGSDDNKIKYNYACGNLGCIGSDTDPCHTRARPRNFWDENVNDEGDCASTNEWENNSVCPEIECTPSPED